MLKNTGFPKSRAVRSSLSNEHNRKSRGRDSYTSRHYGAGLGSAKKKKKKVEKKKKEGVTNAEKVGKVRIALSVGRKEKVCIT